MLLTWRLYPRELRTISLNPNCGIRIPDRRPGLGAWDRNGIPAVGTSRVERAPGERASGVGEPRRRSPHRRLGHPLDRRGREGVMRDRKIAAGDLGAAAV